MEPEEHTRLQKTHKATESSPSWKKKTKTGGDVAPGRAGSVCESWQPDSEQ